MQRLLRRYAIFILFIFLLVSNVSASSLVDIQTQIDNLIKNTPALKGAKVGVYAASLEGNIIYAHNEKDGFVPASNQKIITSAIALIKLGSDYKFNTYLYGPKVDAKTGRMNGDLVLQGRGNPAWSEFFLKDPLEILKKWADELYSQGVREIKGDLVADDTFFDREYTPPGWTPRHLSNDYACEVGALSVNENWIKLIIDKDKTIIYPPCSIIKIKNYIKPASKKESISIIRLSETNDFTLRGLIPQEATVDLYFTIHNPALFTVSVFEEILRQKGIKVTGTIRLIESNEESLDPNKNYPLFKYSSPELKVLITRMNKESDNFISENIFKALSGELKGKGTREGSREIIFNFFKSNNIFYDNLEIDDGSGLSILDKVSPRSLAELLIYMYNNNSGKLFFDTLPISGKDGTLEDYLKDVRVVAKTGTITGYCALSGYLETVENKKLFFSIMINDYSYLKYSTEEISDKIDTIVRILSKLQTS